MYARITWFHATDPKIDIDNIIKPILDTLIGTVYEDDNRMAQCLATRIKSRPKPRLSKAHISEGDREQLDKLLTNNEHVLYIEVGGMSLREVIFGPIDGG